MAEEREETIRIMEGLANRVQKEMPHVAACLLILSGATVVDEELVLFDCMKVFVEEARARHLENTLLDKVPEGEPIH